MFGGGLAAIAHRSHVAQGFVAGHDTGMAVMIYPSSKRMQHSTPIDLIGLDLAHGNTQGHLLRNGFNNLYIAVLK